MIAPLLGVVTLIESAFVWLAIGAYEASLTHDFVGSGLPLLTRLTIIPGLPFPWHGSPWIVLLWASAIWAWWRAGQPVRRTEAIVGHLAVLLGVILLVGTGMLASVITTASVIR